MNDLSQAPKNNLMLEALLARIEQIRNDKWTLPEARLALAMDAAESTTMLVARVSAKTSFRSPGGRPLEREELREKLIITLHDGSMHEVDMGFPSWLER